MEEVFLLLVVVRDESEAFVANNAFDCSTRHPLLLTLRRWLVSSANFSAELHERPDCCVHLSCRQASNGLDQPAAPRPIVAAFADPSDIIRPTPMTSVTADTVFCIASTSAARLYSRGAGAATADVREPRQS